MPLPSTQVAASLGVALALLVGVSSARGRGLGTSDDDGLAAASDPEALWHCQGNALPDGQYCVHPEDFVLDEAEDTPTMQGGHRQRSGAWQSYDYVPRRSERPADYDAYRYPVEPGAARGKSVVSGFDLDQPDDRQRRGLHLRHVGHGGVDLPQRRGAPVQVVDFEHQEGEAEVLFTGHVFGRTVLLLQRVREAGEVREYVVLFGHLEQVGAGVVPGLHLRDGDVIGGVGDSGSPSLVHLHYEVRRMRLGMDAKTVLRERGPGVLVTGAASVPTDPRNLLPLR